MRNWRILLVSLLTSVFLLPPTKTSTGCDLMQDLKYSYRFVSFSLLQEVSEFSPYILTFTDYHLNDEELVNAQRKDNLEDWQYFACPAAKLEDVAALIYGGTRGDFERLKKATKERGTKGMPVKWAKNYFVKQLVKNKCSETFDYLVYAKMCEPNAVAGSAWTDEPEMDESVLQLIDYGKRQLFATDNHYLRLRYMYQIIRLAHYADDYQMALDLYEELDPRVDVEEESAIYWWMLGHKAGCLKRLGHSVQAAYLFSKVFSHSPGKREQAYRSFQINTDEEWKECVNLCHSNEERASLHAMRAMDKNSLIVRELEEIYSIDPRSPYLSPLLLKEISRLEDIYLGADFRRHHFPEDPDEAARKRLIRLHKFVVKVLRQNRIADPGVWKIAQGYLEYLSRDLYAAKQTFKEAEPLVADDPKLSDQLELFELALEVHSYEYIDDDIEQEIFDIIDNNRFFASVKSFSDFLFDRLAVLYDKQNEPAKAFLCNYNYTDLQFNPKKDVLNKLALLAEREKLNDLEEYLLENRMGKDYVSNIYEMKGTYHLSHYELGEAMIAFGKMKPAARQDAQTYSPFTQLGIIDCVHCDISEDSTTTYITKEALAKELLDLEYRAKTEVENAANFYYTLGKAYYNMSYYGHAYQVLDYYRSGASWVSMNNGGEGIVDYPGAPFGNAEFFDCTRPLFFFDKAKELADNDEFAAKACFMAAKCELNAYYQDPETDLNLGSNDIPKLPEKYRNYYDILINKYSDTEFFEMAVEECKFFGMYVEKGY